MSTPKHNYPLDSSIVDRLDPQYVEIYRQHIQHLPQVHLQPVAASRASGKLNFGESTPSEVASITDYSIPSLTMKGHEIKLRAYTPVGDTPDGGWPALLYFHGGGWVLGNLDTESSYATHLANRGRCVVISVDYRLAPEHPFPAAVDDAWDALKWVHQSGPQILRTSPSRLAAGGSSAGGNLTAVLAHMSILNGGPDLTYQVIVVPAMDNVYADVESMAEKYLSWKENALSPGLPALKMEWYRNHYLPNSAEHADYRASPLFAPEENWASLPPAFIAVNELDVLRDEGIAYAERMNASKAGNAIFKVYKRAPHPVMAMDGVILSGAEIVTDTCQGLYGAFWSSPNNV